MKILLTKVHFIPFLPSAGAVELRNQLQQQLGLSLPGTLAFDYPTAAALAEFCHSQLAERGAASAAASAAPAQASAAAWAPQLADVTTAVREAVVAVGGEAEIAGGEPGLIVRVVDCCHGHTSVPFTSMTPCLFAAPLGWRR